MSGNNRRERVRGVELRLHFGRGDLALLRFSASLSAASARLDHALIRIRIVACRSFPNAASCARAT
jgi:hypothetical protein